MTTIVNLLIIGTLLVFLETILVGGIWGVAGIVFYSVATYFAYVEHGANVAIIVALISACMACAAFAFWLYVLPKTPWGKSIYLTTSQKGEKAPAVNFKSLVGKKATALTDMNPSGKVEVDGSPYDARCELLSASAGDKLEVISSNSFELIVRKI